MSSSYREGELHHVAPSLSGNSNTLFSWGDTGGWASRLCSALWVQDDEISECVALELGTSLGTVTGAEYLPH